MEWPVCLEVYNELERVPKTLPACGHTTCLSWVTQIHKNAGIKCAECNTVSPVPDPTSLINNFAVMQLIRENESLKKAKEEAKDREIAEKLAHETENATKVVEKKELDDKQIYDNFRLFCIQVS